MAEPTPMDPGLMRDRITIQRATTSNTGGLTQTTWSNYTTIWARTKYLSGREFLAGSIVATSQNAIFQIRWRDDLTELDRVLFDNRTWRITTIVPVGFKVGLDLYATSVST